MAARKLKKASTTSVDLLTVLQDTCGKLAPQQIAKKGYIKVKTTGSGGKEYYLEGSENGMRVVRTQSIASPPLLEITGNAGRLQAVMSGKKDALKQFLTGGFRVKGDLHYLSDLALALGFLKKPL
jgi:hypothetical protein